MLVGMKARGSRQDIRLALSSAKVVRLPLYERSPLKCP